MYYNINSTYTSTYKHKSISGILKYLLRICNCTVSPWLSTSANVYAIGNLSTLCRHSLHSHIVSLHRSYLSSFIEIHSQSIILPRTRHFDHLPVARRTVATMRWPTPSPPLPLFPSPSSHTVCALINAIARSAIAMPKWAASRVRRVQRATCNKQRTVLMCTFCSVAIAIVTVCCHSERVEERMPWGTRGSWQRVAGGSRGNQGDAGGRGQATRLRLPKCQMAGHIS